MVNVFYLPYDFTKNIFYSLAYVIVRIQYRRYNTKYMLVDYAIAKAYGKQ